MSEEEKKNHSDQAVLPSRRYFMQTGAMALAAAFGGAVGGRLFNGNQAAEPAKPALEGSEINQSLHNIMGMMKPPRTPEEQLVAATINHNNFSILDAETSPIVYGLYSDLFAKARDLLPEQKRHKFTKPIAAIIQSDEDNAFSTQTKLREKNVVSVTSYNIPDKDIAAPENLRKIAYLLGHELGHSLYRYDSKEAKELSGMNLTEVQPILRKMNARIGNASYDSKQQEYFFDKQCQELIADGIALRVTHDAESGKHIFSDQTKHNEVGIVNRFMGAITCRIKRIAP